MEAMCPFGFALSESQSSDIIAELRTACFFEREPAFLLSI